MTSDMTPTPEGAWPNEAQVHEVAKAIGAWLMKRSYNCSLRDNTEFTSYEGLAIDCIILARAALLAVSPPPVPEGWGQLYALANELSWNPKTREIADRIRACLPTPPAPEPKT